MGNAMLAVENYFDTDAFPDHAVSADEEASGQEAWRVATARRHAVDHWTPTTANAEHWIKVNAGAAIAADYLALDRGHNLSGHEVTLQWSDNDSTWTDIFTNVTIPSTTAGNGDLDTSPFVRTDEGAWLVRFTQVSHQYYRLVIPAMGAGLVPVIVGLWLGTRWEPATIPPPVIDEDDELVALEVESDVGWIGRTLPVRRRRGQLVLELESLAEYDSTVAGHIRDQYGRGRPMWIVYDDDRPERAVLGLRPRERMGFRYERGWPYRRATVNWVEHGPET